jgi:hypothetical protein
VYVQIVILEPTARVSDATGLYQQTHQCAMERECVLPETSVHAIAKYTGEIVIYTVVLGCYQMKPKVNKI